MMINDIYSQNTLNQYTTTITKKQEYNDDNKKIFNFNTKIYL